MASEVCNASCAGATLISQGSRSACSAEMLVDTKVIVSSSHQDLSASPESSPTDESLNVLSLPPSEKQKSAPDFDGDTSNISEYATFEQKATSLPKDSDGESCGSCCFVADEKMAGDDQRAEKCIVEIPYSVLLSIYQSLDADKGWESLAGETGYTFDKIRLLELEGARSQGSPGRSLLWELGSRNTTVRQLYGHLSKLERYREMKILEDYANSPAKPSFVENGLRGLKSPDSSMDTAHALKGLKTSSMSLPSKKSNSNNNSMRSDSFNLNQPPSSSDINNSLKYQEKDKQYSGKQMPMPSKPSETLGNPCSIQAPRMKPVNPVTSRVCSSSGVERVQKMITKVPEGEQSSGSSSNHPSCQGLQTSSSATSSPISDLSSSLSSLPGLENSFDVKVAAMGSACFSYAEVVQATNCFSAQNKLGEGAFGSVHYGVLRQNKCAVKKLFEADGQETVFERSTQIRRELTSLQKFRHENIVTLYGYAVDGESLCLIYQYMPNGSLEDRIMCKNNTAPLVWAQRLNILQGACQGLNFLHTMGEQPLIHGDIKSANILLDKYMEAKIGDLGQAQQASGRDPGSTTARLTHITRAQATTKLYGTKAYQPEDVRSGGKQSTKSDIFAMGVVLLEMFSGEKAYDERREGEKYLGDYFRSLKDESGNEACLAKLDRRAGEPPREVAQAILDVADVCTNIRKRGRPDSVQLLQKVTNIDELYRQKTGIKSTGMDSFFGSEHSCHMSHTSSPDASVDNLTAAPSCNLQPPSHRRTTTQTSSNYDINLNKDLPSQAEKHYATHPRRLPHEKKPDNCLAVNMNVEATAAASSSQQGGCQSSQSSLPHNPQIRRKFSPDGSPIDCFPEGQPLPVAFRLQQVYDSQSPDERKRISRLSDSNTTRRISQQEVGDSFEVLPQADPAKLAALEQFDRSNLGRNSDEKDCNNLQSDPQKLATLKQFDDQVHHPTEENSASSTVQVHESNLDCDPQKLAYLRHFDGVNMTTSDIVEQTQREEAEAVASDPHKLATLMQFDAANCKGSVPSLPVSRNQSVTAESASQRSTTDRVEEDTSLVSELDYVVTSQRAALDACNSLAQEQQDRLHQLSLSQPDPAAPEVYSSSSAAHHQESYAASSTQQAHGASGRGEDLLLRQKNFFDLYKALASEEMDDGGLEDDDLAEEADCGEDVDAEEKCSNANEWKGTSMTSASSLPVQERVPASVVSGHCHPVPSEQDETVLNYFKQRQQHYENRFKKPASPHQC